MISPVLLFLSGIIFLIAKLIYKLEKWQSYSKSVYFTFITALTVGYGNTVPSSGKGKFLSIVSAFIGVILTGVIVSVALNAVMISWQETHDTPMEASIQSAIHSIETGRFSTNSKTSSDSTSLIVSDSLSLETNTSSD